MCRASSLFQNLPDRHVPQPKQPQQAVTRRSAAASRKRATIRTPSTGERMMRKQKQQQPKLARQPSFLVVMPAEQQHIHLL